ncbi:hypothetical protein DI243_12305 [Paenibacillus polymyxa]|nr:hypothetical protein DI243_12305 [Paenibacillus polymyxa]
MGYRKLAISTIIINSCVKIILTKYASIDLEIFHTYLPGFLGYLIVSCLHNQSAEKNMSQAQY